MGTEYIVHKDDKVEVSLLEASNKFELSFDGEVHTLDHSDLTKTKIHVYTHDQLTTEQLIEMGVKILQVASYWSGLQGFDVELKKCLKKHDMLYDVRKAVERTIDEER